MPDVTAPISMNSSWRVFFAVAIFLFSGGILMWLTMYGTTGNTMQGSALTGFFWMFYIDMAAVGFGAVLEYAPTFLGKLTPGTR